MGTSSSMKIPWNLLFLLFLTVFAPMVEVSYGQADGSGSGDSGDGEDGDKPAPPPEAEDCDGIFLTYTFISREKQLPHKKNVSAQAWSFKSEANILNGGDSVLKAWKLYVGFQHREVLVTAEGAVVVDGGDLPAEVGKNGTYLSGFPNTDLKNSIDTAGDYTQILAQIKFTGTMFGGSAKATPMPRTIRIVNDGYKCPATHIKGKTNMYVCCKRDPKFKVKTDKTKFLPRQKGDLSISYDVLQSYPSSYLAQVTIDNVHPLGRLDHWNLTWEWMRGEFINKMRGAYTHKKDATECIYGKAGKAFATMDFSTVMNCEKNPIISDLPATMKDDEKIGKLPKCCRNGTLLPTVMNESMSQAMFQVEVMKLPPDDNRTAFTPPQHWKIHGPVNPNYVCGPPLRVEPSEFPDPSGIQMTSAAIASWQVVCNITKPKAPRCCVSFSAYYSQSVVPCNTCACGCEEHAKKCDPRAKAMLLPAEAMLVPFANRSEKAKAWAKIKHYDIPNKLPCADNCPVSLNWHVDSDYSSGWTSRLTLFNWGKEPFQDWYTAVQMNKAYEDYENVYSFNGTRVDKVKNTILFQGLKGLNFLIEERNATNDKDPRVPGKQQSVISFKKKHYHDINIKVGEGFPHKVLFNGEECSLPKQFPKSSTDQQARSNLLLALFLAVASFLYMSTDRFH